MRTHRAVQTSIGVVLGPCWVKDGSKVMMTQCTKITQPIYRDCYSGNPLKWAERVGMGGR